MLAGASGAGAAGYEIERSLRFNSADSSYLNRTPSSAGNRKTWTWSGWLKLNSVHYGNIFSNLLGNNNGLYVYFGTDAKLYFNDFSLSGGTNLATDAAFRDFSAWYHFVIVMDSTQATAADRFKLYVNGVQQTLTGTYPTQNLDGQWNNGNPHYIGRQSDGVGYYLNSYLADVHFIDGQALAATDFGEYDDNNVWQPIKYAGTYGTNGFHLDFSDNSSNAALGTDASGNGNTWTVNNLTAAGNSYTYTNAVTTTEGGGNFYNGVAANLFSASASTTLYGGYTSSAPYDSNIVWTPPGGVAVNNPKITLSYYSAVKINGTAYTPTGSGELTIPFVGTLNTLLLENTDGSGNVVRAYGLKPDGTNLVTITDSASTDALRDSPSQIADQTDTGVGGEVVGNYCTWNPIYPSDITLTDGNLKVTRPSGSARSVIGTIGVSSGKWYWELTRSLQNYDYLGVAEFDHPPSNYGGQSGSNSCAIECDGTGYAQPYNGDIATGSGTVAAGTFSSTSVIGLALDLDLSLIHI